MNRRPDLGRGDGVAGNDFGLVLHPVDRADCRRIIGRVGSEREANEAKKGKQAQTLLRSMHGGSPLQRTIHRRRPLINEGTRPVRQALDQLSETCSLTRELCYRPPQQAGVQRAWWNW